jgi:glyoxylase-like metal-dependent hydrolase (beta-lactamase superfamily II)
MEIAPRIHRIEAPLGDRFVCMYLLVGEEGALLLDTGLDAMPEQYLVPYLDTIGIGPEKIRYVLNSHADFDHTAGNASVRALCPQAIFMCHALDRHMVEDVEAMIALRYSEYEQDHGIGDGEETKDFIRSVSRHIPIDVTLQGGEVLCLGGGWDIEVWHTPGHTYGHISLYDAASNALIIADAALHNAVPTALGAPAFPPTYRYVDTYAASIQRLASRQASTLLTSHYPMCRDAAVAEFLAESRAYVERVDGELVRQLQSGGQHSLRQLCAALGPILGTWPAEASAYLCFPLMGHLERLLQHGRVQTDRRDGVTVYEWK